MLVDKYDETLDDHAARLAALESIPARRWEQIANYTPVSYTHLALQFLDVDLEPGRHLHALVGDERALDDQQVLGLGGHGHQVARLHAERRDVHAAAVHGDMAVTHLLTSLGARLREAKTVHHVVQTALEDAQQVLARDALLAAGDLVVVMELLLQNAVDALGLLLLTQLQTRCV